MSTVELPFPGLTGVPRTDEQQTGKEYTSEQEAVSYTHLTLPTIYSV